MSWYSWFSLQPGDEYDKPPPSLGDASPRKETSLPTDGREGVALKSPRLSPVRLPSLHLMPPPGIPTVEVCPIVIGKKLSSPEVIIFFRL